MKNMATNFGSDSNLWRVRTERLRRWIFSGKERSDLATALLVLSTALGARWLAKRFCDVLELSYPTAFAAGFAVVGLLGLLVCGTGKFTFKASVTLLGILSMCIYVVARYLGI